jgi:hypothetical protein
MIPASYKDVPPAKKGRKRKVSDSEKSPERLRAEKTSEMFVGLSLPSFLLRSVEVSNQAFVLDVLRKILCRGPLAV